MIERGAGAADDPGRLDERLLAPLAERVELKDLRVTILGAGGAARGAAVALSGAGARVTVCAADIAGNAGTRRYRVLLVP